jgi:signal transduction histidine kinase/CheY-like chemotaxis protein
MLKNTYQEFLNELQIPAIIINKTGKVYWCNRAFLDLYDLSKDIITNKNYFDALKKLNVEPAFKTLKDLQNPLLIEGTCIQNKSTTTITIHWSKSLFNLDDQIKNILLIGVDISRVINKSIRELEIKKSIIDYLPSHYIFWKDINSVYLGCNQAFADTMKLNSCFDIIGKTDDDLPTTKEQNAAYRADDKEVIASKTPKLNIEELQNLACGSERVLLTSKAPLFDQLNNVYGVLCIYTDITERKNMQLALERAKIEAETANQAKSVFITNMSHDIRTPLSGVIGMSYLLEEKLNDPEQQQYAQWIRESSEQLLNLLNGVLEVVSANNLTEIDLKLTSCNIRELIKDITQLEQPTAALKNLALEVDVDQFVPELVITDKTKLHRTLLNLIGNAIKFTEKGSVTLKVSRLSESNTETLLKFSIIDTGIGIPAEFQQKIFDRFYRIAPSEKGLSTGSGVGLHIAQSYVKLLGGDIKLTSQNNVGTEFYFNLLCQHELLSSQGSLQESKAEPILPMESKPDATKPSSFSTKNKPKILLIEDNLIAMKIAQTIIIKTGCYFEAATHGEMAYELATGNKFDLIITDIGLPGISGIEFTRRLRKWESSQRIEPTPIIGLTANDLELALTEGLKSGMNRLLSKPLTIQQMNQIKLMYLN